MRMKGIVFTQKGEITLSSDIERPTCKDDEILIRTIYSGVSNGTERNILLGGCYSSGFPVSFGYQIVGEVVQKGANVKDFKLGDFVFSGEIRGHLEYSTVNVIKENLVTLLQQPVEEETALLGLASVAMHDCRRLRIDIGDKSLVVGLGLIGQFTAQICKALQAVVVASDISNERTNIAKSAGCDICIEISSEKGLRTLNELKPYDVIFEDSGSIKIEQLLDLVKYRGVIVLIAGRDSVAYPFVPAQVKEVNILHASHFSKDDTSQVIRLMKRGNIKVGPLISDVLGIQNAKATYEKLRDNPSALFGTIFKWQ
jgi:2-desacetyl-2-hydroxyethyl bacteriochlorophyllide A dehydrogenase